MMQPTIRFKVSGLEFPRVYIKANLFTRIRYYFKYKIWLPKEVRIVEYLDVVEAYLVLDTKTHLSWYVHKNKIRA